MKNAPVGRLRILTGTLSFLVVTGCVSLLWRAVNLPVGRVSDSQAMSIGYGSSHERDRVHALGAAARRNGKLSAGEMDEAKKLFLTGGQTSRELVIETFGSVSEASQHSQILEFLDQVGIDANTAPFWRITFRKWREELRPRDTGFGTRLATSPNPSVQQFAHEEAARTQNP